MWLRWMDVKALPDSSPWPCESLFWMSVRQGVRWRWLPGLSAFDHGDVSRKHVGEPHLILDTRQNFGPVSQLWPGRKEGSSPAIAKQTCDAGASNSTASFHQALCVCRLIWASQQPSQSRYCYHSHFGEGDGGSERHSNSNWVSIGIVIGLMSFSLWLVKWGFKLRSIWSRGLACSSCRLWISISRNGCLEASWERWELRRVLRVLLFLLPAQTSVASAGISI